MTTRSSIRSRYRLRGIRKVYGGPTTSPKSESRVLQVADDGVGDLDAGLLLVVEVADGEDHGERDVAGGHEHSVEVLVVARGVAHALERLAILAAGEALADLCVVVHLDGEAALLIGRRVLAAVRVVDRRLLLLLRRALQL